ncbi:MAG: S9 family peptidase [Bacteroidetes bacterium]|nr:MAG: S9 family peptidase [Bacteroidota bacterium]
MKYVFWVWAPLLLLAACQPDTSQETAREVKNYTIEQFMNNTSVFGGSFSHDEKRLLVTGNETGIYNAYSLQLETGEMKPLTASTEESVFALSYFPQDDRFLFSSDQGGNEISHIFLQDEDGTQTELTPGEKAKASYRGWAHDRKSFFFTTNQRDPRFMDLYEMDIQSFEPVMIYQNDAGYSIDGLSNDKRYLAFSKPINTNDSELFLYDREADKMTKISGEPAFYSAADFSADNNWLYYLTDAGNEFKYLMRFNIGTGEAEEVMKTDWDIMYAYHSYNDKYRVVGINEDAKTRIHIFEIQSGQEVQLPDMGELDISSVSISRSENQMIFSAGSSKSTSNLYHYDFASGTHRQLTNTLNPEIDPDDLVAGQVVRYPSFDGLEIPAILYKPHQASANSPVPALVWVHGGPGGQSRLGYFPLVQYLVNHGYAVLAVNNRGSSGYGKTFYKMDDRNHGEKDLMDCVEGKNFLAAQDYVDPEKIGIIGGSYGGFMVMAALTSQPEEFAVGVNLFGVTNWLRTLKNIPPWWESFKDALYQEMGDPATDSVRLYNISPLFHADKVTKPLMVLQGAQDPRVLQVESDEIVEAVKKNGVPVEYVLFEDEGHGFVKKENQIEAYGKILQFLDKYLKGAEEMAATEGEASESGGE